MKKKYLFIGVGSILFFILITLILLTFNLRKGVLSPETNNNTQNQSQSELPNYSSANNSKPSNSAIEDISVTPKKTQSNSLSNTFSTPTPASEISNSKLQITNKFQNPNFQNPQPSNNPALTNLNPSTTLRVHPEVSPRGVNQFQPNSSPTPSLFPTPTSYQFNNDDPNAIQFMGTKLGPGLNSNISSVKPRPVPTFSPAKSGIQSTLQYRYFSQCDGGFDNYPMPEGCALCEAGCGPTTLAMILSTYLNKTYTPADVVDLYKQNGFYAGCDGTKITDAQTILDQKGIQTTDFMMLVTMTKEDAIAEMKKYIDAGWTIFTLGRYCDSGCSHFFWITNIDNNNKVWSYDPFYNKNIPPPLDVRNYTPFPEYRLAFGVKK